MHDLFHGVLEDFSDLHTPGEALRITVRLLLAAVLGGILGFERERSGKSAGMRTHMLVAIACGFFVLVPQQLGMSNADLSRRPPFARARTLPNSRVHSVAIRLLSLQSVVRSTTASGFSAAIAHLTG